MEAEARSGFEQDWRASTRQSPSGLCRESVLAFSSRTSNSRKTDMENLDRHSLSAARPDTSARFASRKFNRARSAEWTVFEGGSQLGVQQNFWEIRRANQRRWVFFENADSQSRSRSAEHYDWTSFYAKIQAQRLARSGLVPLFNSTVTNQIYEDDCRDSRLPLSSLDIYGSLSFLIH